MQFFSKMFPVLQRSMLGESLDDFSAPLPAWGTMQNGVIYEHQMSERPTSGGDGSAWPTPTASDFHARTPGKADTFITGNGTIRRRNADGTSSNLGLVQTVKHWTTPTADDANNVTRKSGDYRSLVRDVNAKLDGDLKPNPEWWEMLMGYPVGWTAPDGPPLLDRNLVMSRPASQRTICRTGPAGSRSWGMRLCLKSYIRWLSPSENGLRCRMQIRRANVRLPVSRVSI